MFILTQKTLLCREFPDQVARALGNGLLGLGDDLIGTLFREKLDERLF